MPRARNSTARWYYDNAAGGRVVDDDAQKKYENLISWSDNDKHKERQASEWKYSENIRYKTPLTGGKFEQNHHHLIIRTRLINLFWMPHWGRASLIFGIRWDETHVKDTVNLNWGISILFLHRPSWQRHWWAPRSDRATQTAANNWEGWHWKWRFHGESFEVSSASFFFILRDAINIC